MNEINRLEKDSVLYYQGGGKNITLSSEKQNLREFYNVNNSYIVINAMLMPGISNERARLQAEERKVDLVIFNHMDELIEVYCRLYSAMCKYTFSHIHEESYHTYRDDRMNTLEFLEHGQMYSFMSTKKRNVPNTDFHDKDGILLLEVEAPGDMEHVDVNAVLGEESIYPHEEEILFAPFALLDKEPLELTEVEKCYKDRHENPPSAKYLLHLRLSSVMPSRTDKNAGELKELYARVMDSDCLNTVRQIWESFMNGKEPETDAAQRYVEWKEKLQIYLKLRFAGIKYEVMCQPQEVCKKFDVMNKQEVHSAQNNRDRQNDQELLRKLKDDIIEYYDYTYKNQIKYKKCVQRTCVALAIIYPLTSFFVALSFLDKLEVMMKVASLLSGLLGAIISTIASGLAWNEKLQQRTATYLKLDELLRDMKYEKSFDEDSLNRYVEQYKTIVRDDDKMGQENAGTMGSHLKEKIKESEEK